MSYCLYLQQAMLVSATKSEFEVFTYLRDLIIACSDYSLVLSASISLQVCRELRICCLRGLYRDNHITRQIGNACHYSHIKVSTLSHGRRLGPRGVLQSLQEKKKTYQPLQQCESLLGQPCCQWDGYPSAVKSVERCSQHGGGVSTYFSNRLAVLGVEAVKQGSESIWQIMYFTSE